MTAEQKKCGYVALLGRPNAGKSTLMNACLGAKISVVSAKPQTTRNRILGVYTEADTQVLFVDTPGIHKTESLPRLNKVMNKVAWSVVSEADLICYLVDSSLGWTQEDTFYLKGILEKSKTKIMLVASKIDSAKKDIIDEKLDALEDSLEHLFASYAGEDIKARFVGPIPYEVSAKRPESVAAFRAFVAAQMPDGPWLYAQDDLTDKPQQFICAEIIREQVFRQLSAELPYQIAVKVDKFTHEQNLTRIQATLIVQKDGHKGIVIGKGGAQLKSIGTQARISLEKHLDRKVFLELFVKVQQGWIDNASLLAEYAGVEEPG